MKEHSPHTHTHPHPTHAAAGSSGRHRARLITAPDAADHGVHRRVTQSPLPRILVQIPWGGGGGGGIASKRDQQSCLGPCLPPSSPQLCAPTTAHQHCQQPPSPLPTTITARHHYPATPPTTSTTNNNQQQQPPPAPPPHRPPDEPAVQLGVLLQLRGVHAVADHLCVALVRRQVGHERRADVQHHGVIGDALAVQLSHLGQEAVVNVLHLGG